MKRQFLLPGEYAVTREEMLLETLLGSCVAVCLSNTRSSLSAMNHFLLPGGVGETGTYADSSTEEIISQVRALDPNPSDYRAHIYGGAELVASSVMHIGERNVKVARTVLGQHGIAIVGEDVGGTHGRRITFDTTTGETTVKVMASSGRIETPDTTVLVVDRSEESRSALVKGLSGVRGISVVGEAEDPFEAREKIISTHPDAMTLGIGMRKMDGLHFLEALMQSYPIPVVIISWITRPGSGAARAAREKGAAAVVFKEDLKLYDGGATVREKLPKILWSAVADLPSRQRLL